MGYAYGWRTVSAGLTKADAITVKAVWQKNWPRRRFKLYQHKTLGWLVRMYGKLTASQARNTAINKVTRPRKG